MAKTTQPFDYAKCFRKLERAFADLVHETNAATLAVGNGGLPDDETAMLLDAEDAVKKAMEHFGRKSVEISRAERTKAMDEWHAKAAPPSRSEPLSEARRREPMTGDRTGMAALRPQLVHVNYKKGLEMTIADMEAEIASVEAAAPEMSPRQKLKVKELKKDVVDFKKELVKLAAMVKSGEAKYVGTLSEGLAAGHGDIVDLSREVEAKTKLLSPKQLAAFRSEAAMMPHEHGLAVDNLLARKRELAWLAANAKPALTESANSVAGKGEYAEYLQLLKIVADLTAEILVAESEIDEAKANGDSTVSLKRKVEDLRAERRLAQADADEAKKHLKR